MEDNENSFNETQSYDNVLNFCREYHLRNGWRVISKEENEDTDSQAEEGKILYLFH